jgi:hypothetical protein
LEQKNFENLDQNTTNHKKNPQNNPHKIDFINFFPLEINLEKSKNKIMIKNG